MQGAEPCARMHGGGARRSEPCGGICQPRKRINGVGPTRSRTPTTIHAHSIEMLDVVRQAQPGVLTLLINRYLRLGEPGIGKSSDRHGDESRHPVSLPAHGGAAVATKSGTGRRRRCHRPGRTPCSAPRSSRHPKETAPAPRTRCPCVSGRPGSGRRRRGPARHACG